MTSYEMTAEQRRIFVDTQQLHEAFVDAFAANRKYYGGMHWKKAKGREYLFRTRDRYGYGSSLGPRSPKTESIYTEFHKSKKRAVERLKHVKERLREQARFCKAARLGRVPRTVTAILRLLEQHQVLGQNLMIVGTNALYAYEARAGIFLRGGILATRDMDVLWDIRPRLRLFVEDEIDDMGFMGILKKADRSFEMLGERSFRAVNKVGYMVDLLKTAPASVLEKDRRQIGGASDLSAAEIKKMQWLLSAPKLRQVVIGDDGYPAAIIVPDPRAFAVHKIWLSKQPDRESIKKRRDRSQALATIKLVAQYMPDLAFKKKELRMFPKAVVQQTMQVFRDDLMPAGYEA